MKKLFTNPAAVAEVVERYLAGETGNQLARSFGCTGATVLRALRSAGVQPRTTAQSNRLAGTLSKENNPNWRYGKTPLAAPASPANPIVHSAAVYRETEYMLWAAMKRRCADPKRKWHHGKGITVCSRWLKSYENFVSDMGRRPTPTHTIERIDNRGNYEPSNCRWATAKEQMRNKSNNVVIEYRGERMALVAWAERLSIPLSTLYYRISKGKWTAEKAFTVPLRNSPPLVATGEQS